jgi:integrase
MERRFLTRDELARLLDEVPGKWRPLFDLLAVPRLRISEAIALRWSDLELDSRQPRLRVNRAMQKSRRPHRWAGTGPRRLSGSSGALAVSS